jgi:hypothetical protein
MMNQFSFKHSIESCKNLFYQFQPKLNDFEVITYDSKFLISSLNNDVFTEKKNEEIAGLIVEVVKQNLMQNQF